MLLSDRNFNTSFFDPAGGGDPVLFQHLFLAKRKYAADLISDRYTNFKKEYERIKEKKSPDNDFLDWLIGFIEGDGCFSTNNRKEQSIVITQGVDNKGILEVIKKQLGIGSIEKQGQRVFRLTIRRKEEVRLLILLLNGNLVLPTRKVKLNSFINVYNSKNINKIAYITSNRLPSLNDAWLVGFTEAEGCFSISLLSNSKAYRTRYLITQKGDINLPVLSSLILLFNTGVLEGHSIRENYSYIVNGIKNVKLIYDYFDKYKFLGIKRESYLAFKEVNKRIEKGEHLDSVKREEIKLLVKNINRKSK